MPDDNLFCEKTDAEETEEKKNKKKEFKLGDKLFCTNNSKGPKISITELCDKFNDILKYDIIDSKQQNNNVNNKKNNDIIYSTLSDSIAPVESVYVVEHTSKTSKPFPYWQYFEKFCQDLAKILYDINKISENTIDAVSKYLSKENEK